MVERQEWSSTMGFQNVEKNDRTTASTSSPGHSSGSALEAEEVFQVP